MIPPPPNKWQTCDIEDCKVYKCFDSLWDAGDFTAIAFSPLIRECRERKVNNVLVYHRLWKKHRCLQTHTWHLTTAPWALLSRLGLDARNRPPKGESNIRWNKVETFLPRQHCSTLSRLDMIARVQTVLWDPAPHPLASLGTTFILRIISWSQLGALLTGINPYYSKKERT